jgi:hypothetical protein
VPTSADRGVSRGQSGGLPTVVNLSFLDRSRYFPFKYLIYPHEAEWTPFQTHSYAKNLVAPGMQARTSGLAALPLEPRVVAVGLERGPISLVCINEELLARKIKI